MNTRDSESGKRRLSLLPHSRMGVKRIRISGGILISLLVVVGTVLPNSAKAGVFSDLLTSISRSMHGVDIRSGTVQTIPVAEAAKNLDPRAGVGGGDITIVDGSALMPEEGPSGTIADIEKPKNQTISLYVVRPGDTLSSIAELFGVSTNTILWANDLKRGASITPGQTLTILPVTGIKYTVKQGDSLDSIAKKFSGDPLDIANFNGIDGDVAVGDEIIIPDGEAAAPAPTPTRSTSVKFAVRTGISIGYYAAPLMSYIKTQGIHGYNAVDLADPIGTPILASADGDIIVAKNNGAYNGGYGNYVVIQHDNGSQTLYGHQSRVIVSLGQHVVQGQVIGYVGSTGRSTGPHLHFEIRNGIRNPF